MIVVSVGVGAVIGYVTNYFAIKMLFRPYKPLKVGNFTLFPQGVIPREKAALAKKVGEVVREYILSEEEVKKIVTSKEVKDEIDRFLDEKIETIFNKDINEFLTKEELADRFALIISKVVAEKFPMFSSFVNEAMLKELLLNLDIELKVSDLLSKEKTKETLKIEIFEFINKEIPAIFLKAHIDKIVEEKVNSFDERKLEEMLFSLMDKHFGFINFAGAFLGGVIGAVQYLLFFS